MELQALHVSNKDNYERNGNMMAGISNLDLCVLMLQRT